MADPFTITLGAIGVAKGLVGGITSAINSKDNFYAEKASYQAQAEAYLKQEQELTAQLEVLNDSHELSVNTFRNNIFQTQDDINLTSSLASRVNTAAAQNAYDELTSLYRQAASAEGQTNAAQALTGFKQTGTLENIKNEQNIQNQNILKRAEEQTRLSIVQNYINAGSTRQNYENQLVQYRTNLELENMNYSLNHLQISNAITEAQNMYAYYDQKAKDMGSWSFWDGVADFFGGLF